MVVCHDAMIKREGALIRDASAILAIAAGAGSGQGTLHAVSRFSARDLEVRDFDCCSSADDENPALLLRVDYRIARARSDDGQRPIYPDVVLIVSSCCHFDCVTRRRPGNGGLKARAVRVRLGAGAATAVTNPPGNRIPQLCLESADVCAIGVNDIVNEGIILGARKSCATLISSKLRSFGIAAVINVSDAAISAINGWTAIKQS